MQSRLLEVFSELWVLSAYEKVLGVCLACAGQVNERCECRDPLGRVDRAMEERTSR